MKKLIKHIPMYIIIIMVFTVILTGSTQGEDFSPMNGSESSNIQSYSAGEWTPTTMSPNYEKNVQGLNENNNENSANKTDFSNTFNGLGFTFDMASVPAEEFQSKSAGSDFFYFKVGNSQIERNEYSADGENQIRFNLDVRGYRTLPASYKGPSVELSNNYAPLITGSWDSNNHALTGLTITETIAGEKSTYQLKGKQGGLFDLVNTFGGGDTVKDTILLTGTENLVATNGKHYIENPQLDSWPKVYFNAQGDISGADFTTFIPNYAEIRQVFISSDPSVDLTAQFYKNEGKIEVFNKAHPDSSITFTQDGTVTVYEEKQLKTSVNVGVPQPSPLPPQPIDRYSSKNVKFYDDGRIEVTD